MLQFPNGLHVEQWFFLRRCCCCFQGVNNEEKTRSFFGGLEKIGTKMALKFASSRLDSGERVLTARLRSRDPVIIIVDNVVAEDFSENRGSCWGSSPVNLGVTFERGQLPPPNP